MITVNFTRHYMISGIISRGVSRRLTAELLWNGSSVVEQWTENSCVGSSILPRSTNYGDVAELCSSVWLKPRSSRVRFPSSPLIDM